MADAELTAAGAELTAAIASGDLIRLRRVRRFIFSTHSSWGIPTIGMGDAGRRLSFLLAWVVCVGRSQRELDARQPLEECPARAWLPGIYREDASLRRVLRNLTLPAEHRSRVALLREKRRFASWGAGLKYAPALQSVRVMKRAAPGMDERHRRDAVLARQLRRFELNGMRPDPNGFCSPLARPVKDVCASQACTACIRAVRRDELVPVQPDLNAWQLFADDWLVAEAHNLQLVLQPPEDVKRVISTRFAFRDRRKAYQAGMYASVELADGAWALRMKTGKTTVGTFGSNNGMNWTLKTDVQLGVSSTAALISRVGANASYVAVYQCNAHAHGPWVGAFSSLERERCLIYHGLCMKQSLDGTVWHTVNEGAPVIVGTSEMPINSDTAHQLLWTGDEFLLYTRVSFATDLSWRGIRGVGVLRSTTKSRDCLTMAGALAWNECMLASGPWRPVKAWKLDAEGTAEYLLRQAYCLGVQAIAGVHYGFLSVINKPKDTSRARDAASDTVNTFLITSRDGIDWDLGWVYARTPLLANADWYSGLAISASNVVTHGGRHWLYFEGSSAKHDQRHGTYSDIGVAVFGENRFVGLQPRRTANASSLRTRPFVLPRGVLHCDLNAIGSIEVALKLYPCRTSPCVVRTGNFRGGPSVTWRFGASLQGLDLANVVIEFQMQAGATLFGLRFR